MSLQDVVDEIGQLLGIRTRNALSLWERDKNGLPTEVLDPLSDFYGVTIDYLLGREGAVKDAPNVTRTKEDLHGFLRLTGDRLTGTTPEERLATVYRWVENKHCIFSSERMSRRLSVSVATLSNILEGRSQAGRVIIQLFSDLVGVPEPWFYVPTPVLFTFNLEPYRRSVVLAHSLGISPEALEEAIRLLAPQPRKT
jgi:transcriptional regulator with XRE-family HTH domain